MVQWVLIGVGALWPLIAFAGGLGYSPLIAIAAVLCLPSVATRLKPQLYMVGIAMLLEFVAASAKWSPRHIQLIEFTDGKVAMRFEVVRLGLTLLWSGILMAAAYRMSPKQARRVVRVVTWAILAQLVMVALLSIFEKQALQLFAFAMPEPGEGIQNISRNGIIMAMAAPLLIVGFSRQMAFSRALLVEITVFVVISAVLAIRGVNGPILSVFVGLAAVAVVRLFPRNGFRIMGAAIALVVLSAPLVFGAFAATGNDEHAEDSLGQRMAIWRRATELIDKDPIFGQGLGVLRTVNADIPFEKGRMIILPNHAHNMALQLWTETGLIGAGLFAIAVLLAAFRMPEPRRLGVAGFLAAALAGQFMAMTLSFDLWNDWWWACAGLLAALIVAMARAEATEDPSRMLSAPSASG